MDYTQEIVEFLYNKGYKLSKYSRKLFMINERADEFRIIEIIPEPLRGQSPIDYKKSEAETEALVNQVMLRHNKKVERLTLALFQGMPDISVRNEISDCDHFWCVDVNNSVLYLYENQVADFDGIREPLESCLAKLVEKRAIEKKIERKRYITPVNFGLIAINITLFAVLFFLGDTTSADFMAEHGGLTLSAVVDGKEYYRLFTCMFIHFGLDHLLQNMLLLFVLGSRLERITGKLRYLLIYIGAGLVGAAGSLFFTLSANPYVVCGGASGAIFGVMGGLLFLIVKDFVEKRRKRVREIGMVGIIFMIGAALYFGFTTPGVDNMAHLCGLIGGFILTGLLMLGE